VPLYTYRCDRCGDVSERRSPVGLRNTVWVCKVCDEGLAQRLFVPTANITIPAAFGVFQRDLTPPREAMEYLGNDSQSHAPKQESLEQFLERDLRQ
jgi:putative FmdB family regulatory protein